MALTWNCAVPRATHRYLQLPHIQARSVMSIFVSEKQRNLKNSKSEEENTCLYHASLFTKRKLLFSVAAGLTLTVHDDSAAAPESPHFYELQGSNGVKAVDIREGTGRTPQSGDKVVIHYFARLAAKQGWRFDSTYDHKDNMGVPEPFVFTLGADTVIQGLNSAVATMKEGGVRRVIIPPSQGYQNRSQDPVPPNVFDRQRLYTTIFNRTRLANGEGSTLGTLVFDIELMSIGRP